jgi:prophage DNA circulation protein
MAWQDRLREAAYNTPSGARLLFLFEDVSNEFSKKTSAFNFPDADGTFVQDNGRTGRQIPLRIFLSGNDYDIEADTFIAGLSENGVGKLEHPVYGTIDVIPFGSINRRDNLKTASNQAVLEVTFFETIDILFPSAQVDPASVVLGSVEEYNTAISNQFEELIDTDTAIEKASFKNGYQNVLGLAESGLQKIADTQDNVRQQFNAVADSINNGIDILVDDPLTLAFQTTILLQTPALAVTSITDRFEAYSNLLTSIIDATGSIRVPGNDSQASNAFQNDDLIVSTAVTGIVISVINNQFETKTDALSAADELLTLTDSVINWRDANYQSLDEIDTGASYQKLLDAVALTAGFLVQISFTLKQERSIVLDSPRTIIDLAAELYGTVDDITLNFLINSNNLSGSEILELPKGKEIVFFV